MTEEEFISTAIELLQKDFNLTYEEAKAMAELSVILDKNGY